MKEIEFSSLSPPPPPPPPPAPPPLAPPSPTQSPLLHHPLPSSAVDSVLDGDDDGFLTLKLNSTLKRQIESQRHAMEAARRGGQQSGRGGGRQGGREGGRQGGRKDGRPGQRHSLPSEAPPNPLFLFAPSSSATTTKTTPNKLSSSFPAAISAQRNTSSTQNVKEGFPRIVFASSPKRILSTLQLFFLIKSFSEKE